MKTKILFLFLFTLISNIYSQNDSVISVDHSKVTLATDIIPQWKIQTELGGSCWYTENTFTHFQGAAEEYTATYYQLRINNPALAFRIGVFKNIEIRLGLVFIQDFYGTLSSDSWFFNERRNGIYSGGPIEAGLKAKPVVSSPITSPSLQSAPKLDSLLAQSGASNIGPSIKPNKPVGPAIAPQRPQEIDWAKKQAPIR